MKISHLLCFFLCVCLCVRVYYLNKSIYIVCMYVCSDWKFKLNNLVFVFCCKNLLFNMKCTIIDCNLWFGKKKCAALKFVQSIFVVVGTLSLQKISRYIKYSKKLVSLKCVKSESREEIDCKIVLYSSYNNDYWIFLIWTHFHC